MRFLRATFVLFWFLANPWSAPYLMLMPFLYRFQEFRGNESVNLVGEACLDFIEAPIVAGAVLLVVQMAHSQGGSLSSWFRLR